MKMRFVITGEYDIEDNLAERLNNYGTTDPAECAAVDMQHKPGEWLYLSHTRVTMFHIEPAEGDGDDSRGDRPDSPAPGTPGLPSGNPVPVGPGLASYDPSINWPVIPGGHLVTADANADYAGV
jgi:hypothetical protein